MTTSINELRFHLALAETNQSQLRAKHYAVRIDTEVWKERKPTRLDGTPLTEQEVLASEVGIMHNHITLAEQHIEAAKGYLSELSDSSETEQPRGRYSY